MVFRRRNPLNFWQKTLGFFWPRSGLRRAWLYIWYRIARLPGTAYSIAAGFASGAAVSFTPFLGLHFLMGFALAWVVRGNLLASAIGTAIGNPWTFPFIFALTSQIGSVIVGHDVTAHAPSWDLVALSADPIGYIGSFVPIIFPLIMGGIPVAIFVWFLFYFAFRGLISGFRDSRRLKLEAKAKERASKSVEDIGHDKA